MNNKQRRAAKAKQRAKARAHAGHPGEWDVQATHGEARRAFRFALVGLLGTLAEDPRPAAANAATLLGGRSHAARLDVLCETLSIAEEVVVSVVRSGWSPADLAEILRRRAGEGYARRCTLCSTRTPGGSTARGFRRRGGPNCSSCLPRRARSSRTWTPWPGCWP